MRRRSGAWATSALMLVIAITSAELRADESPPPPASFPVDAFVTHAPADGDEAGDRRPRIIVRNTTLHAARRGVSVPLQAVVIRHVRCNGAAIAREWTTQRAGAVQQLADGRLELSRRVEASRIVVVEQGLLLPGEQVAIEPPAEAKGTRAFELTIEYAVITPGRDWTGEVLLLEDKIDDIERFAPATARRIHARGGRGGGRAILRSQLDPLAPPLKLTTWSVTLKRDDVAANEASAAIR